MHPLRFIQGWNRWSLIFALLWSWYKVDASCCWLSTSFWGSIYILGMEIISNTFFEMQIRMGSCALLPMVLFYGSIGTVWLSWNFILTITFVLSEHLFGLNNVRPFELPLLRITIVWILWTVYSPFSPNIRLLATFALLIELFLRQYYISTIFGYPTCKLRKVRTNTREWEKIKTLAMSDTTPLSKELGVKYQKGTRSENGIEKVSNMWRIEYYSNSHVLKRWRNFRDFFIKKQGKRSREEYTWHASYRRSISAIAANGFELVIGRNSLGKLFGKGIYQSFIADVCAYYAGKFYCQKNETILVLSKTLFGEYKRIKHFHCNKEIECDSYIVLHTNGERLGNINADYSRVTRFLCWITCFGPPGESLTGDEVCTKSGAQILPQYLVNVKYTSF